MTDTQAAISSGIPGTWLARATRRVRGGGWVKASGAPAGAKLIENMVAKGWIEKRRLTATEISYRLTDAGLAAKKAPVPIYGRKSL